MQQAVRGYRLAVALVLIGACSSLVVAAEAQPARPSNVQATQNGSTLRVTWTGVEGESNGYLLTFHVGSASENSSATRAGTVSAGLATSIDVPIPPGAQGLFNVVVAAVSGIGASDAAEFVIGNDGVGCTGAPPTPTGLTGSRVFRTTNIRFNPSLGAGSYLVHAGTGPGLSNLFIGNIGNVTAAGSDALDPSTPLYVRVFAVNPCGTSAPTSDLNLIAGQIPVCVPDAQTMCLFDGRFEVRLSQPPSNPAFVTRRFNDGGGFNFTTSTGADQLFVRVFNNCATGGGYAIQFANVSGFPASTAFDLFIADRVGSIARTYTHPAGTPFTTFQDTQSFNRCP